MITNTFEISKIKQHLRIAHDKLDNDIIDMVSSCLKDLDIAGVSNAPAQDPLIFLAIKLFLRWHFNFDDEADRYKESYKDLKNALALSGDYKDV